MSRASCRSQAWSCAVQSLRNPSPAAGQDRTWRPPQGIFFARKKPMNQTWVPAERLRFAQASVPPSGQTTSRPPKHPRRTERQIHTSIGASSVGQDPNYEPELEPTRNSQTRSRPHPNLDYSTSFNRDDDFFDDEVVMPLYGASRAQRAGPGPKIDPLVDYGADKVGETETAELSRTSSAAESSSELSDDISKGNVEQEAEEEPFEESLVNVTHFVDMAGVRKAMKATPNHPDSYWKYTLYADAKGERPLVHYCTTIESINRVTEYFADEPILGFDLEWLPSASSSMPWYCNVSIIQIASQSRIAIFHVTEAFKRELVARGNARAAGKAPAEQADAKEDNSETVGPREVIKAKLASILENPDVLKVGVNVVGDARRMKQYCEVNMRGLFELSHLFKLVTHSEKEEYSCVDKKLVSLARQVTSILQLPLFKGDVRTSNWAKPLEKSQILYAASDAYAGLQIFIKLDERRRALEPRPPLPELQEKYAPIRLAEGVFKKPRKAAAAKEDDVDEDAEAALAELEGKDHSTTVDTSIVTDVEAQALDSAARKALDDEAQAFAEGWTKGSQAPAGAGRAMRKPFLRSWYMWHVKAMEPKQIASLLGVQVSTVNGYVCSAIWQGKLPFDKERFEKIPKPQYSYIGAKRSYDL